MKNKSYDLTVRVELFVNDYITDQSRDEVEDEFTEELHMAIFQVFGGLNGGGKLNIENFEIIAEEN